MDNNPSISSVIPSKAEVDAAIQEKSRRDFIKNKKAETLQQITPNNVDRDFQYIRDQNKDWTDDSLSMDGRMERIVPRSFTTEGLSQQDITEVVIERGSLNSSQIGSISEDKIIEAVGNVVQISGVGSVGPFNLANNTGVTLTSTLSDNQDPNRVMLGIFEVDAWQDSIVGGNQIPYGSNTINANYDVVQTFDYNRNQNSSAPHTGITAMHQVYNKSGSSHDIYWRTRWRFIGRNTAS